MRIRILFCHFHADPDPSFQITAENLKKCSNRLIFHLIWLFTFKLMRIRIQLFHFDVGADPDPTFQFDADTDSDPTFQFDPDPQHWTAVRRFRIFFPFSTPCRTRYWYGSGSGLEWKAGSAFISFTVKAQNRAMEGHGRPQMEIWRLKMEPWSVCSLIHLTLMRSRIRVRIEVKSWIPDPH